MNQDDQGVIHGRFQPLHLGHMEYLLEGKARCRHLWIGISNPEPSLTAFDQTNPSRSERVANPFTYLERLRMIRDAMIEAGVPQAEFDIVPFPINFPCLIENYAPLEATYFVTVYDEWGRKKVDILTNMGVLKVDVMWERKMDTRLTSGKAVRQSLMVDSEWKKVVPPSVVTHVERIGIGSIRKRLAKEQLLVAIDEYE